MSGRTWIRRHAYDMVSTRARNRRRRPLTALCYVHRFDVSHLADCPPDALESIPWFFQEDPEGVITVTVPGSYRSKLPMLAEWREHGIPPDLHARAFPAYTFGIREDGALAQYLPIDAAGAHAGGRLRIGDVSRRVNEVSVSIALLGDYRNKRPTEAQEKTLKFLLRELMLMHEGLVVLTHTEGNAAHGVSSSKQCPGDSAQMMVDRARAWASGAVRIIGSDPKDRW